MSPSSSSARDVFMYLLVVVVLAMCSVALGSLLFDLVNVHLPDPALQKCWYDSCNNSIRTALAVLVVAFPVLLLAWRSIRRDIAAHPEKEDLKIRKWLLYFTLFVAGVVVIADLISLINSWLQGELTTQFALKVLSVFVIASLVFSYFLGELRGAKAKRQRALAWAASVLVLAAVIVGFITAGSPAAARARRIDATRAEALQMLQYQLVDVFWTGKGRLPATLAELEDPVNGFKVPVDPETGAAYEYTRTGDRTFELCATFTTASVGTEESPSRAVPYPAGPFGNWEHGIGRVCFERTIDPQLYPVKR